MRTVSIDIFLIFFGELQLHKHIPISYTYTYTCVLVSKKKKKTQYIYNNSAYVHRESAESCKLKTVYERNNNTVA